MKHLMRCPKCRTYTLKESCSCSAKTIMPKPPKYSPDDKYASYRRKAKEQGAV